MTKWWRPSSAARKVVAAVAVTAVVMTPLAAYAMHQFSDVPSDSVFHDEISAAVGAGIATGFPDGTFKPLEDIKRQAVAGWMVRGGGRAARSATGGAYIHGGETETVGSITLEAGADRAGNGFAHVNAFAYAYAYGASASNCPCMIELRIVDQHGSTFGQTYVSVPGVASPSSGYALTSTAFNALAPMPADSVRTFRLVAYGFDGGAQDISVSGNITAEYVPFSGDGDNTASMQFACPEDDGYEQNDSSSQRALIYPDGKSINGIACPGDEDWFGLSQFIGAGDTLTATAFFTHTSGNIDLCIVHSSGSPSTCSTTTGSTEEVSITSPNGGLYFIRLYLASESDAVLGNTYSLYTSYADAASAAELDGEHEQLPSGDESDNQTFDTAQGDDEDHDHDHAPGSTPEDETRS